MRFRLNGEVSSDDLSAIRPVLAQVFDGQVTVTPDGFRLDGVMEGDDARDVNRRLLSALRRAERRTRLRAQWTADGVTYRFFDYALKSERPERETHAGPLGAGGRPGRGRNTRPT